MGIQVAGLIPENSNQGLASLIPLNAKTFLRNIMRDNEDTSSLLNAEDFSPEEIELIYKSIDRQEAQNYKNKSESNITHVTTDEAYGFSDQGTTEYETDPVTDPSKSPNQVNPFQVIKDSFNSPAYNIQTTLGQYTSIKNEDGSVTIKDNYNWGGQKGDPEGEVNVSLSEFIEVLPYMTSPELAGNALMRTFFKDKKSPIEFNLPPRKAPPVEMPEEYSDGGRVRLI